MSARTIRRIRAARLTLVFSAASLAVLDLLVKIPLVLAFGRAILRTSA